jgi:hypothetical protein
LLGKHLLRIFGPKLSATDIAVGHKQLLEVQRGWRAMKQVIDGPSPQLTGQADFWHLTGRRAVPRRTAVSG